MTITTRTKSERRAYRQTARAAAAEATRERILTAAVDLLLERFIDELTLEAVAERAGVTVQTVLRKFGSRSSLLEKAIQAGDERFMAYRRRAPPGDVAGAVAGLYDQYEEIGDRIIRTLAQEEQVSELRRPIAAGRVFHREWVERTFEPQLRRYTGQTREHALRALIVVTDIYTWKLLRRDMNTDRLMAEVIARRMIQAITDNVWEGTP